MDKLNLLFLSVVTLFLLSWIIFLYLYTHKLIHLNESKSTPIAIEWHARWDWVIVLIIILIAVVMGFKLITLMVVVSDSMVPEFQRGDMILAQSFELSPMIGDIITFTTPEVMTAVTHRVVRFDGERIRTKGDSTNLDYFKTTQKDIIAKAIQINGHPIVIPKLGALFITDYAREGTISRYGDTFTFMQQLSTTISTWGHVIAIIGIILLASGMKR